MSRKPDVNSTDNKSGLAPSFLQARRELFVILAGFMIFLIWVLLACWVLGYQTENGEIDVTLGLPSWVLLGVALPWLGASVFTFWFCLRRLSGENDSED
ncbi:MAG: hypothetical protein CMI30_05055 [Opitutae bacterium]|nr:hypothetical protein [Opitutae bacterium]